MMKMQAAILAKEYAAELIQFFFTALLITCMNIFTYQLNKQYVNSRRGHISFTAQEDKYHFNDPTVKTDLSTISGLKKPLKFTGYLQFMSLQNLEAFYSSGKAYIYQIYYTQ